MTMDDRDGVIWLDGQWVEWREAKVHVLTHTLHYGLGVFEGIRAYHAEKGTAIFKMQDHTDRLFRSAHIMNMKMPYGKDETESSSARCGCQEQPGQRLYPQHVLFRFRRHGLESR